MAAKRVTPLSEVVDKKLYIAGLTRSTFAQKLNVSYSYISAVFQGRMLPTVEMSKKMAALVGMDPREFRELALDTMEAKAS